MRKALYAVPAILSLSIVVAAMLLLSRSFGKVGLTAPPQVRDRLLLKDASSTELRRLVELGPAGEPLTETVFYRDQSVTVNLFDGNGAVAKTEEFYPPKEGKSVKRRAVFKGHQLVEEFVYRQDGTAEHIGKRLLPGAGSERERELAYADVGWIERWFQFDGQTLAIEKRFFDQLGSPLKHESRYSVDGKLELQANMKDGILHIVQFAKDGKSVSSEEWEGIQGIEKSITYKADGTIAELARRTADGAELIVYRLFGVYETFEWTLPYVQHTLVAPNGKIVYHQIWIRSDPPVVSSIEIYNAASVVTYKFMSGTLVSTESISDDGTTLLRDFYPNGAIKSESQIDKTGKQSKVEFQEGLPANVLPAAMYLAPITRQSVVEPLKPAKANNCSYYSGSSKEGEACSTPTYTHSELYIEHGP